ncbi:secreted RxLR effector protein 161-like [Apium graveolens]|uniref:secreted RxLR effector protein 161-like n=1 Tax=Apium graveolens TaxID=4045 RepID=UPI003D7B4A1F
MEVQQMKDCIELKQSAYTKKILEKAGMQAFNPNKYPMDPNEHLTKDEGGKLVDPTEYQKLGWRTSLPCAYMSRHGYAVGIVSRFMEKRTVLHMNAVKRILRYVKGTINYGVVYSRDIGNNMLTGYSNSDFGGQTDDRKSTRGMVFYLNDNLITWVSQKQRCVALSSCEAEFMAGTTSACQAVWLRNLLSKLTGEDMGPVILYISWAAVNI